VMSLRTGVAAAQREAVTTFLSGDLNVGGFFKVHPDTIAPIIGDSRPVRSVVEPLVPAGCQLRERGRGRVTAGSGKHRTRSYVVSLDAAREGDTLRLFKVKEGSLEHLDERRTVALSRQLATRLHVQLGDSATLFTRTVGGLQNALDLRVVAITDRAGLLGESSGILVSNATLRELSGYRPEAAGSLQLTCGAGTDIGSLGNGLREALRQAGFQLLPASNEAFGDKMDPLLREAWAGQRLDVSTWEDESSFLSFVTVGLGALAVLVGLIVVALVMVGLFVSLTVAVRERTREIGTLRALGMQRPSVVGMFVLEGLLLGLTGSATGAGVASLLCVLLREALPLPEALSHLFFSGTLPLEPRLLEAAIAVLVISLGSAVASIIPAARAASLPPRSAMESL
jgi:putative ABC transport system permease protein